MSDIKERYKFVTDENQEWQCVGIVGGKYDGVVYRYGQVSLPENIDEEGAEEIPLSFEWEIVDSNGLPKEMMEEDFYDLIGDILCDIIMDHFEGALDDTTDD